MVVDVTGEGSVAYQTNQDNIEENYNLHVFGDIMPTDEEVPRTFEEALKLMKRLPSLVSNANDGKGKPLKYIMVPLSLLAKYLKISTIADRMIKDLSENSITRVVQLFDEISGFKQQLYDLYEELFSHKYCVPYERIKSVESMRNKIDSAEASLR